MIETVQGPPSDDELRQRWRLNRLSQFDGVPVQDEIVAMRGTGAGPGTVRIGGTVRRAAANTPPAMLWVLDRLADAGFDGAPRLLGLDADGRYVLQYVPGATALPPYGPWVTNTHLLASVAELLAAYHSAARGLGSAPGLFGLARPDDYSGDVVGHLDVSCSNVVVRAGRAVALIDFEHVDLVCPLWDVARTVRHWVPLVAPGDLVGPWKAMSGAQAARLRTFADHYGLGVGERERLPQTVIDNADYTYEYMRRQAEAGFEGYVREWRGEHARRNRRGRRWVADHRAELTEALLADHQEPP